MSSVKASTARRGVFNHASLLCLLSQGFLWLSLSKIPAHGLSHSVTHSVSLAKVDQETSQEIRSELSKPQSQFDVDTMRLVGRALQPKANVETVYKAILYRDACAWAGGHSSAAGTADAMKLHAAFLQFKLPSSFESTKALVLMRQVVGCIPEDWKQLKSIAEVAPGDEFLHLSYLIGLWGYGDIASQSLEQVHSECDRILAAQPRFRALLGLDALACYGYGKTPPKGEKGVLS